MTDQCYSCKRQAEVFSGPRGLRYCNSCVNDLPSPSVVDAMGFLFSTIPFKPGDTVEARTAGEILDGVGRVEEVSFDLLKGGTPVYPSFRVVIDEKAYPEAPDEAFYTECCLTRVK